MKVLSATGVQTCLLSALLLDKLGEGAVCIGCSGRLAVCMLLRDRLGEGVICLGDRPAKGAVCMVAGPAG